jgi:hypothetical protein
MKLLGIIKMLMDESYRIIRVDKHISDIMLNIKNNFKHSDYL